MTPVQFFYQQAGYSYPLNSTPAQIRAHRLNSARRLAAAERWAQREGLEVVWREEEYLEADHWPMPEDWAHVQQDGARYATLYRPCPDHGVDCKHAEALASLGMISESLDNRERDNYRRLVNAELALEAMP